MRGYNVRGFRGAIVTEESRAPGNIHRFIVEVPVRRGLVARAQRRWQAGKSVVIVAHGQRFKCQIDRMFVMGPTPSPWYCSMREEP